jgi:hypothetical protein
MSTLTQITVSTTIAYIGSSRYMHPHITYISACTIIPFLSTELAYIDSRTYKLVPKALCTDGSFEAFLPSASFYIVFASVFSLFLQMFTCWECSEASLRIVLFWLCIHHAKILACTSRWPPKCICLQLALAVNLHFHLLPALSVLYCHSLILEL